MDLHGGGDVHGGGVGVVAALALVYVVVGMDRALAAQLSSEHLDRSVGDDLVGVHVGLGAGPCLPDHQGEVVIIQLAGDDLIGGLADGLGDDGVETELGVDLGRRLLEDAESLDDGLGHPLGGAVTDGEVHDRPEGLGPIILF